jgi:Tfp pilus assembly protein PilO
MRGSDKAIVLGVLMAIVLGVFYLKVLSPKRDQASSLKAEIEQLQGQIDQQKQAVAFAEDARRQFPTYYSRLVVMGKAAPATADTSSLLVQLNTIAHGTHVHFDGVKLSEEAGETTPASSSTSTSSSTSGTSTTGTSTTSTTPSSTAAAPTTTPTPATEASAATLPLGAAVGPAGLPTMPYELAFTGRYFDVADFINRIDDLVHTRGGIVSADGRLLTINGFNLKPGEDAAGPNPKLDVKLTVASFVTGSEGVTAGATPGGPAPSVGPSQAQPASATVTP